MSGALYAAALYGMTGVKAVIWPVLIWWIFGPGKGDTWLSGALWAGGACLVVLALQARFIRGFARLIETRERKKGRGGIDDVPLWVEEMTETIAGRAGLPCPEVGLQKGDMPFVGALMATSHADTRHAGTIIMSQPAIDLLNRDELGAVIAHEIAHLKHSDPFFKPLIGILVTAVVMTTYIGLHHPDVAAAIGSAGLPAGMSALTGAVATGIVGSIALAFYSRFKEFRADRTGVALWGTPGDLITALRKLDRHCPVAKEKDRDLRRTMRRHQRILGTHPPTHLRIKALEALA